MKRIISYLTLVCALAFVSCGKDSGNDDQDPGQPGGSTFLPLSISFEHPGVMAEQKTSIKYLPDGHTIELYSDDLGTANPYDHLRQTNLYNGDGYFIKRQIYQDGAVVESIDVERTPGNTISRVITSVNYPDDDYKVKDTFNLSFYDSATFKVMKVDNLLRDRYKNEFRVSRRFVFSGSSLVKTQGGTFWNQSNSASLTWPNEEFVYDGQSRLSTHTRDFFYGKSISYDQAGIGLDSFYQVLGGVDGHYLNAPGSWGFYTHEAFTSSPLKLVLFNNSGLMEATMHISGVISEVRSIPNGVNYPNTEIFSFDNILDQRQRVKQTTVRSKNEVVAIWKVEYPAR
ncbi:hypothetical protein [Flavihumibacter solisilvae]|nr:hypothetical protein [Flavihumibacter solisilvae]